MKRVLVILIIVVFIQSLSFGCDPRHKEIPEYHEEIRELEEYVLDDLGNYIFFSSYERDAVQYPPEKNETGLAYITICFKKSYIYGYNCETERSPVQIVETVRRRYNQYVSEHENFVLSGYIVKILFSVPIDYNTPYEEYAILSNEDYETAKITGDKLTTISLYEPRYIGLDYTYPFGQWDECYQITDLEIAELDNNATIDRIIEVADNMPFLKYIVVKDQQTADQASALRPDVKFVSVSGR